MKSTYVGAGSLAVLSSRLDQEEREEQAEQRAQDRAQLHSLAARLEPLDAQAQELCSVAEMLAQLALFANGYRQHDRGQWRRRRINEQ